MAITSGPGGYGINIPISIDLSGSFAALNQYMGRVETAHARLRSLYQGGRRGTDPLAGFAKGTTRPAYNPIYNEQERAIVNKAAQRAQSSQLARVEKAREQALIDGLQVYRTTKKWPGLDEGYWAQYRLPPKANSSPAGQPQTFANKTVGAMNAAIGGWRQLSQGAWPTQLGQAEGTFKKLKGISKFFGGKDATAIPGYSDFTTNRTSNTSFLGSVTGGLFHNYSRFSAIQKAAESSKLSGTGVAGKLAVAAVIYKGVELAARVGATQRAWALKSGEAAIKTTAGKNFDSAVAAFDYINNIGTAINDSFKMTADFGDTVSAVTGKLPDTQKYLPRFHRIAQANLQFESMVRRNLAMTRAGAMGNSDVADQVKQAFFNAAAQR
jgi:hypothetical protein